MPRRFHIHMMSYVLNMILYVISYNDIICTFHMKIINKSYVILYLSDFRCI